MKQVPQGARIKAEDIQPGMWIRHRLITKVHEGFVYSGETLIGIIPHLVSDVNKRRYSHGRTLWEVGDTFVNPANRKDPKFTVVQATTFDQSVNGVPYQRLVLQAEKSKSVTVTNETLQDELRRGKFVPVLPQGLVAQATGASPAR